MSPIAAALLVLLVVAGCEFARHGHLPRFSSGDLLALDGPVDQHHADSSCSICRIAHDAAHAVGTSGSPVRGVDAAGLRPSLHLLGSTRFCTENYSPRAPPRPDQA